MAIACKIQNRYGLCSLLLEFIAENIWPPFTTLNHGSETIAENNETGPAISCPAVTPFPGDPRRPDTNDPHKTGTPPRIVAQSVCACAG
jgi:hypothetical protein